MIHIQPRGCPGSEIEYDQVASVLGSTLVGPNQGVVNIEAFKGSIILNEVWVQQMSPCEYQFTLTRVGWAFRILMIDW